MLNNKTESAIPAQVERNWYVVSARGQVLGRLAARVAAVLRGKHRPDYTPHVDCGDFVIITDAEEIQLTGKKATDKMRYWHTGYIGHLRSKSYGELLETDPEDVIWRAVKGMLPHNTLGRNMIKKLKVYRGSEHPHSAQQPEPLSE
ncbi:MAG: 50S ribosomal protein L13 [candidate division WS1 bacterium]|jgi:large subunit ribosomal protein L13|nr:50S ribosomal protein L13 [candidate division WS1 bacterium]